MVSFQELEEEVSAEDEVEDGSSDEEEDLGAVEEERSVILHLLSQLKLGMDLTRVGGTYRSFLFLQESMGRSLFEMCKESQQ